MLKEKLSLGTMRKQTKRQMKRKLLPYMRQKGTMQKAFKLTQSPSGNCLYKSSSKQVHALAWGYSQQDKKRNECRIPKYLFTSLFQRLRYIKMCLQEQHGSAIFDSKEMTKGADRLW